MPYQNTPGVVSPGLTQKLAQAMPGSPSELAELISILNNANLVPSVLNLQGGVVSGSVLQCIGGQWSVTSGFPYAMLWNVSGTVSVATDVAPWQIIPKSATGIRVWAWCKTQPGTQEMLLDVMRSPLNAVTGYGSFVSIFSAGNKPGVASIGANGYSIPNLAAFNAGDAFRLDVTQVGISPAGADLTVCMLCNIIDINP